MTSTDDILDQIDSALYDATVSPDAMRSRPDSEPARTLPGTVPVVQMMDAAGEWQELEGVVTVELLFEAPPVDPEFARAWREMQEWIARVHVQRVRLVAAMLEDIRDAFQGIAPVAQEAGEAFQHLPEATGCDDCSEPVRPRDRPAWQSPYGPPQRRR
ncbi:hypothetical protein ABT119_06180 [Streptomyces sp. NPDC001910]|uniref:hypothetical protein n=1 Tax=Streptomyces sp. NPDC001910 TaxID=3154403 RepID=UPI003319DB65